MNNSTTKKINFWHIMGIVGLGFAGLGIAGGAVAGIRHAVIQNEKSKGFVKVKTITSFRPIYENRFDKQYQAFF